MSLDDAMPTTQKGWVIVRQGRPRDALAFKTDVPVPKPSKGEVLVRVHAAALNPVGWKLMDALPNLLSRRPHPAEHDLAGVIVDANDTSFSNGDQVIGFISVALQFTSRQGALAQYVTLPADHVTPKPAKLTWEEAAALPLAALTAVQALRLGGHDPTRALSPSPSPSPDSVFINGGSTSVGLYAIQLAKALSLQVTASTSTRNASLVLNAGADALIDYTAGPLVDGLVKSPPEPRFDMVLDAVGSLDTGLYARSEAYVNKGGTYVTTGPWPDQGGWLNVLGRWAGTVLRPSLLGGVSTAWRMVNVENRREDMQTLCALIERGVLRPYVDSTYEFESALDAYDRLLTGRATGKVVVKVE